MKHCKGKNSLKLFSVGKEYFDHEIVRLANFEFVASAKVEIHSGQWNLYLRVIMTVLAFLAMNSHPQGS